MNHDLNKLHPFAFENLVVALARRVLGPGVQGLGPGPDAGRDAIFEGRAPYPSRSDEWKGIWYIQAKFYDGHADSGNKWLLRQIREELARFSQPDSGRRWPDIWIVATNVDPSGAAETGAFDRAKNLVRKSRSKLASRFHIWGGKMILDYLNQYPDLAVEYAHLLSPGHVIADLLNSLKVGERASSKDILRYLIVDQIEENKHTRLQDAGSKEDSKPGIHELFRDLPYAIEDTEAEKEHRRLIAKDLLAASHQPLRPSMYESRARSDREGGEPGDTRNGKRAEPTEQRIWFVKAGPGRGKSTVGQYLAQIWRSAAILDSSSGWKISGRVRDLAKQIKNEGEKRGHWPSLVRVPIQIELKNFAQWMSSQIQEQPRGIVTYLAERLSAAVQNKVGVGLLRSVLSKQAWFIHFDGLDEVPSDYKDDVGHEVARFIQSSCEDIDADVLFMVTSRAQGYSGQFDQVAGVTVTMCDLTFFEAVECARPLIAHDRTKAQAQQALDSLQAAGASPSVANLMRTPLQSHIMAIVVRDGHEPPDRRWLLFENFYEVMRKREAGKKIGDPVLHRLFTNDGKLLKTIHNRTGFLVHARAEEARGATTHITRSDFDRLVKRATEELVGKNPETVADAVKKAATERLVLVNTPDNGNSIRFDIRQLQEFFAGEFIYDSVEDGEIIRRLQALAGDAHWREVIYFAVSAFIEESRASLAKATSGILADLDLITDGEWTRPVVTAMARGAHIVLHLAEEGVFEQDKRMREQFSRVLRGCATAWTINELDSVRLKQDSESLEWVLSEMLDVTAKSQTHEERGAFQLILEFMPDGHPRIGDFIEHLQKCSNGMRTQLLSVRCGSRRNQRRVQRWVFLLLCDMWGKMSPPQLSWNIVQYPLEAVGSIELTVEDRQSVGVVCVELLSQLSKIKDVTVPLTDTVSGEPRGALLIENLSAEVRSIVTKLAAFESETGTGMIDLVGMLAQFALTRRTECIDRLITASQGVLWWCDRIPLIGARLMTDDLAYLIKRDRALGRPLPDLLSNEQIVQLYPEIPLDMYSYGPEMPIEAWRSLCQTQPMKAAWYFLDSPRARKDWPEMFIAPLRECVANDDYIAGMFGKHYPEVAHFFGPLLRQRLLESRFSNIDFTEPLGIPEPVVFDVALPHEAALLPYCAMRIIAWIRAVDVSDKRWEELQKQLHDRITPWKHLREIRCAKSVEIAQRCAATIILELTEAGTLDEEGHVDRIVELVEKQAPSFFIEYICLWMRRAAREKTATVNSLLSRLLTMPQMSIDTRNRIEDVIVHLRENSFAPVRKMNCDELWVYGQARSEAP